MADEEQHETTRLFRCPGCKSVGAIDDDQVNGRVSIECENCGWHHTLKRPLEPGRLDAEAGSWE